MHFEKREEMFKKYNLARDHFMRNPQELIDLEEHVTNKVVEIIQTNLDSFVSDYNEASFLNPFWSNYPPENRGRLPRGDQVPWIEVGEHAIGHKLSRLLSNNYSLREVGLPAGSDDRFLLTSSDFLNYNTYTNSIMFFSDVKSVGPRDNFEHIVLSPYQISGDGIWNTSTDNVSNTMASATGLRRIHNVWPAIPPIYVLSDGTVAPVIHIYLKPVYKMLSLNTDLSKVGQPLEKIRVITVPNGLLLTQNPNYLNQFPRLFFPGKDDQSVSIRKRRCRVSFQILQDLHKWRVQDIEI